MQHLIAITCLMLVVGMPAAANTAPPPYSASAGDVEGALEFTVVALESSDLFEFAEPWLLFGVGGGVFVVDHFRLGLAFRAQLGDPDSELLEVTGNATVVTTLGRLRLEGYADIGYSSLEAAGSDFIVTDRGVLFGVGARAGVVIFDAFAINAGLGWTLRHSIHGERNSTFDDWIHGLRASLTLTVKP